MNYPKLFSPIEITPTCVLKNRIVKTGQSTWLWNEDGTAQGSRAADLYESIARGGAGAVIVGGCAIEDTPGTYIGLWDDKFIPGLQELTSRVHSYGCKIFAQFHHSGPAAWPRLGALPISSSTLSVDEIPMRPPNGNPCRGISKDEIREMQEKIVASCVCADRGGFDGMEVHVAHGYFLNSFVSKVWNRRTDEYGCQNVENRTRIVCEILQEARKRCRPEFVLGIRMNGREYGAKNGITIEEAMENAKAFEAAGAQFLNVAGYGYGPMPFRYCPDYFPYPEPEDHMKPYMDVYKDKGLWTDSAKYIKQVAHVPVITAGRMNEDLAERVLNDGDADIIGLGRTLWADPEFPNKVREGRIEDVVRCTRCSSCENPVTSPRICRVNPALGHEREYAIVPAAKKKKVMIVGGGPAGMEAARVAHLRGHDVTLYDSASKLGGRINLASMIKGTDVENVLPIRDYLTTQIRKLGIRVRLNTKVTRELVLRERPDVVLVATGGKYPYPDIPGIHGSNVTGVKDLSGKVKLPMKIFGPELLNKLTKLFLPVGRRVVILGGQIEGLQGAVFLAKRGRKVTVLEQSATTGAGIPERYLARMPWWFARHGVEVMTEVKYEQVNSKGVQILTKEGISKTIEGDTVMVLMSQIPDTSLVDAIKDCVSEVHSLASTNGAEYGLLINAIHDGRKFGVSI